MVSTRSGVGTSSSASGRGVPASSDVAALSSGGVLDRRASSSALSEIPEDEIDPATRFLYVPHSLLTLFVGGIATVYFSGVFAPGFGALPSSEPGANARRGLAAALLAWLTYSVVQGPSTAMVRPHPAFWRLVHGLIVAYALFMLYVLFLSVDEARALFGKIDPALGVELDERAYGGDCALTELVPNPAWSEEVAQSHPETPRLIRSVNWRVLKGTLFDEFVAAHVIGWWGKALMLRDRRLLWLISAGFECMELTFKHWLPNFNECWWDSWILDFAVCNALGIELGMACVRYFDSKEYNWSGLSRQTTWSAKARRGLAQLTPHSWRAFSWAPTSSPLRALQCLFPIGFFLLFELTGFFLKYELWIPPTNPMLTARLFLLLGLGLPGMREFYEYMGDPGAPPTARPTKLGSFAWTGVFLALVEVLICIKFGRGEFTAPFPTPVVAAWSVVLGGSAVAWVIWTLKWYVFEPAKGNAKDKNL